MRFPIGRPLGGAAAQFTLPLKPWLALAAIMFLLPHAAMAAEPATGAHWQFAGWHGGGCYPNVEFDPKVTGRVYLASDVVGVWRSDDNGESWRFATDGLGDQLIAQIAVSPASSETVYAAGARGLYHSTNAARSWIKSGNPSGRITFERPASHRAVSPHPTRAGSLCVGTSKGESYCSEEFGREWKSLGPVGKTSAAVTALARLAGEDGMLAGSADGLFRYASTDRGWQQVAQVPGNVTDVVAFAGGFAAAADGALWLSDSTGLHWRRAAAQPSEAIFRLEPDRNGAVLYAALNRDWGGNVALLRGTSWTSLNSVMRSDARSNPTRSWAEAASKITSLKASPFDPGILFRTDWWGVWRSDDGGKTWQERIAGTPNTVGSDLIVTPEGHLLAATMDNGILGSRDNGKHYDALFPKGYRADLNGHIWRIVRAGNRLIAASSPWNAPINQVLLSDDGGRTFRPVRNGLPARRPTTGTLWHEGFPRGLAVDPHDSRSVYLSIDGQDGGGLFVSRDTGETWLRLASTPPALKIYSALAVDSEAPATLYWGAVGTNGGIYRSTDGGNSWNLVFSQSRSIFDIHVSRDGSIYASGELRGAAVFVSRDHGTTWSVLKRFGTGDAAKAIATSPSDPRLVVTSSVSWVGQMPQHFYLSRDGGATWLDVTGDLPPGPGAAAFAFTADGRHLFMSRYAGGIYRLDVDGLVK